MHLQREELNGKTQEEAKSMLESEMVKFAEEVENMLAGDNTREQIVEFLKTTEEGIVRELDDYDKYLDEVEYNLPASCDFDDEHFTRAKIAKIIVKHLNKNEIEWKFALGMYQMIKLWSTPQLKTIKYKPYDSTLRMLGQVKYKGYDAWKEILVINEYASKIREAYALDTAWLYFLSDKHNYILDKMKSLDPESPDIPDSMVEQ